MKKVLCLITVFGLIGLTGCNESLSDKLKTDGAKVEQSEAAKRMGGGKPDFPEIKFRDPSQVLNAKPETPKSAEEPKGK